MKKTKNSAWKRVAAGALSMALVAGAMPANVGGFLTGGNGIVAHAALTDSSYNVSDIAEGSVIDASNNEVTVSLNEGGKTLYVYPYNADGYGSYGTNNNQFVFSNGVYYIIRSRYNDGTLSNDYLLEYKTLTKQNVNPPTLSSTADRISANQNVASALGLSVSGNTQNGAITYYYGALDSPNEGWSTTAPTTVGNYCVYAKVGEVVSGDKYYPEVKSNTVSFKIVNDDLIANTDYTAPTAANVTYTGSAQALVTGGGMTEAGAAKGTMQYALGKVITSDINFNDLAVNDILKIRDSSISISNINSIVLAVNTYQSNENNVITISDGDYLYFNNIEMGHTYQGGAAFKVTKIDREQGIVYVEPVDENADLVWSEAVPNATNAGTYSVSWRITGAEGYNDVAPQTITATIAKATLTASTATQAGDYTAPTAAKTLKKAADEQAGTPAEYYDDLYYTGDAVDLINKGTVANGKGTMQYAIGPYIDTNERVLTTDELKVGTILQPTTETGFTFPENVVVKDGYGSPKRSFKLMCEDGSYKMDFIYDHNGVRSDSYFVSGFNAIRIDSIDNNGMLLVSIIKTSDLIPTEWANDVPKAKEIGNYNVYYRVKGDANHNDTAPAFVTSTIEYATASLTLSPSLTGAVIVENGATEALEATDGVYTLAGTKKYNIYTNKSIADSTAATALDLTSKSSNKTFGGNTYSYRYEIEVPTTPAEGGYILSHTNNYVGKVSTEVGKANVMNIQEDGVTTENVAVLNADGVIYYGDQLDAEELVTIAGGYSNIVNVDEIYIANTVANGGGRVNIDNLTLNGTYVLTAKVTTDTSGDKTDDDTSGNTVYLKQTITFKARPMNKNSYFLQTEDGLIPLAVTNNTVTVPENYWVCTPIEGGSNSYIRTEEPDAAINALFNCTKKSTFVYNSKAQKPVIVVKNGGDNSIVLADTAVAANETATPPVAAVAKDYNNAVAEKTDAGSYNYALTAEANGNYSGSVTVNWTIAKADIQQYISVAPKNNVDTDNVVGNDAIVYDGAVLDGTDFEVKTNEAYAALTDSDADKATKALVDEFIDQLKAKEAVAADPANNVEAQPAVPAKTFVNVRGGQYEVTTDITYDSEISSSGVSINANSVGSYSNVILKGNLTFECSGGDFTEVKITCGEYVKSGSNSIQLTLDGNDIKCGADIVLTKNDNEWFKIVSITHGYGNETNEYTINLTTVPKTETRNETYDIKNAGNQAANVTVSNSNFKTVEFKQKLDNNGKPVEGEDNSVAVTIAKRDVTLTPDDDLSITYRDTVMPDLTYTIEDAKADGLTGVVAADKALFQKTTGEGADVVTTNTGAIYVDELVQEDTTAAAVNFVYALDENNATDYTTAGLNNAGSYKYAAINDAKFDNYNIVLPVDIAADEAQGIEEYTAPTFTVAPLNLNNIADLQIVLNGVTDGWTQNGNSGSYTYDGSTKQVQVKSVSKAKAPETIALNDVSSENYEQLNFDTDSGFNVKFDDRAHTTDYQAIVMRKDNGVEEGTYAYRGLEVTAPSGATIEKIELLSKYPLISGAYAFDTNNFGATSGQVSEITDSTITVTDINSNTVKINLNESVGVGMSIHVTDIKVTYSYPTDYTLTAGTDYTVGGATKRASANNNHEVQVMGKGNYTGVAKAPWQIVTAEAGEAALTLSGATIDNSGNYDYTKVYDGKAVTGAVTFTDPASDYAVDAEVEYKYYQGKYTKEEVTGDNFNATAIEAPVNAFYSDENNVYHIGTYTVVATITCDGYADQVLVKTVHIAPIDLTVNAAAKNITYGDDLPAVTQADIDAIVGLTDDDSAYFQKFFTEGKLKFRYLQTGENTYSNNKIQIIPIISTEEEISAFHNVVYNYNTANFYWNVTEKAKSIKDSSIKVEFTEGDTIVLKADGTFASDNAIKVYDTAILGADGKATELTELGAENAATADYELTIESTATDGVYTLELIGKNNYRGVRKIQFKAITAAQNATTFTENAPKALNNGKTRVVCSYDVAVADGFTITEKGLLYCNNGSVTDVSALVLNSGNTSIKTAKNYTYGNIVDNGQGVICVAYAKVMDADGNTEVLYSGNLGGKYSELMSTFTENAPKALNNGKNRVVVSYEASAAEGCTITESGLIYSNDGSVTDVSALVLNSGNASIKTAKNYTYGNIVDNGYGVIAVAYAKVTDSAGNESVIYSGNLGGKYTELIAAFTENAPTAMNNGKNRVVCSYSVAAAEGYTIDEKGLIYSNDGTVTDASALVLESGNASIKTAKNYTYGNIVDNGYGVIAVAYAKVTDSNGNTIVVYSGNLGGKYAVLQIS